MESYSLIVEFEELEYITVECEDGKTIDLIRGGIFVLPGTEELNLALGADQASGTPAGSGPVPGGVL